MLYRYVFGYGSLLNEKSLLSTVSEIIEIKPALISGYRRDFGLWVEDGMKHDCADQCGKAYYAMNAEKKEGAKMNGVLIKVDQEQYDKLVQREKQYDIHDVEVYDFVENKVITNGSLFVASKGAGGFNFDNPAQLKYLQICLEGARSFGQDFYDEFVRTTYIGDKSLANYPQLSEEVNAL